MIEGAVGHGRHYYYYYYYLGTYSKAAPIAAQTQTEHKSAHDPHTPAISNRKFAHKQQCFVYI